MEYMVVKSSDKREFEKSVRAMIDDGWIPQGGVSMAGGSQRHSRRYVQALIKN